jgi:hypothetical protein
MIDPPVEVGQHIDRRDCEFQTTLGGIVVPFVLRRPVQTLRRLNTTVRR